MRSRFILIGLLCIGAGVICIAATPSGRSKASLPGAETIARSPGKLPLHFSAHEKIAFVGGSLAERMNLFGNFEALLHTRFPQLELVVRNFARPCDAVGNRQRPNSYTALDDPMKVFGPDTLLCFFGFNESFAGAAGEEQFRIAYGKYLDEMAQQYAAPVVSRCGLC